MNSDRIEGEATRVGGKIASSAGELTGDSKLKGEGTVDQVKGAAQSAVGRAEDTARDYLGDEPVDQVKDATARVVEQGRRYVDAGRRYVDDRLEQYPEARRVIENGRSTLSEQVRDAPLPALVIAGAVGFGLALLLKSVLERD